MLAQGPAFKPLVDTVPTSEAKSCFTVIILHELNHIEALLLIPTKTKKKPKKNKLEEFFLQVHFEHETKITIPGLF